MDMKKANLCRFLRFQFLLLATLFSSVQRSQPAGITLITHGLKGNSGGWVTSMAVAAGGHFNGSPGASPSYYDLYFTQNSSGQWVINASFRAGNAPTATTSGEVILMLDWSQLADGDSFSTEEVAPPVIHALTTPGFFPQLTGKAAIELPIHLIGHSRGGSLVSEIANLLGQRGIWVDQLTTLDPHPLNNDGFDFDALFYSAVDASVRCYENVLFADNYWQDRSATLFLIGESVSGAYNRYLWPLPNGYSLAHQNVHLWYHGTIDLSTPVSDGTSVDTGATITSGERATWYAPGEGQGAYAGFAYSLIGRGNRFDVVSPAGAGTPSIRDGLNQRWDFGAGATGNRTQLPSNDGSWPNLILLNVLGSTRIEIGQPIRTKLFRQYGGGSPNVDLRLYLDNDLNPYNGGARELLAMTVPRTGTDSVYWQTPDLPTSGFGLASGSYAIYGRISDGTHTRYLYAPEFVELYMTPPAIKQQPQSCRVVFKAGKFCS